MKEQLKRLIRLFGEDVLVVGKKTELDSLVSKNIRGDIWLGWEVLLIKQMDDEMLKVVHLTKTIFPGAILSPK